MQMITAVALSIALSSTAVPPGEQVVNHAHPAHYGQPTIRVFERRAEDADRKQAWVAYCRELDQLWAEYRAAGSTPAAWRIYVASAGEAKRRYVTADPYLMPITNYFAW
jgi:hypothetical protein